MTEVASDQAIKIFSDGGSRAEGAASACLFYASDSALPIKIGAYLGNATNNEAEIIAALLGFALRPLLEPASPTVFWTSDSEYVLKSATQYIHTWQKNGWKTADKRKVKNLGLWRVYLELARGVEIKSKFVYGHSGHDENEVCDSFCSFLIQNPPSDKQVYFTDGLSLDPWYVVDLRDELEFLRQNEEGAVEAKDQILAKISNTVSSGNKVDQDQQLLREAQGAVLKVLDRFKKYPDSHQQLHQFLQQVRETLK
ncbi:hypothetical protein JNK13_12010 [bacterium]|nr:hypothetical protein [bacterium]